MSEPMEEKRSLEAQCRQAIEKLDAAIRLHARELETEVDQIQRDVVRLRDGVIERLRKTDRSPVSSRCHTGLDGINSALSLIVGVEYPITSIQRSALEQARDQLKKILAEDSLSMPAAETR